MDYMDADWTPVRENSRRESGHGLGIVLTAVVVMAAMAAIANSIVDAKLESARVMAAAVTGAVMGMGGAAS